MSYITLHSMLLTPVDVRDSEQGKTWERVTYAVPSKYKSLLGLHADCRNCEWHVPQSDLSLWIQLPGVVRA